VCGVTTALLNYIIKLVESDIEQWNKSNEPTANIFIKANNNMIESIKSTIMFIDALNPSKEI